MGVFCSTTGRSYYTEYEGVVLRKVSQVFNNNRQGRRLTGRPKSRWWICVQTILISAKLQIEMRGKIQS
jgi:hypothetical protein